MRNRHRVILFQINDGGEWKTQFSIPASKLEKLIYDDPPINGHVAVNLTDET